MSRNKGYVYVSKNRVERPQFRPRSSSELSTRDRQSFQSDPQDDVGSQTAPPQRQRTPPPPVPPLPNGAGVENRPPQRMPSPEVDRGFYSSADVYSHGRLPLEPPWSRPDPLPKHKQLPTSPREEKRVFVRLDDDPRTATPSSDGKTASASVSPTSDSPPEPQRSTPKKRNTLKKKIPKIISKRKEESLML